GGEPVALADEGAVTRATGAPVGFAGPVGLGVHTLADASLRGMRGAVSGANRADEHVVNLDLERDVPDLAFADLRQARGGDRCPRRSPRPTRSSARPPNGSPPSWRRWASTRSSTTATSGRGSSSRTPT